MHRLTARHARTLVLSLILAVGAAGSATMIFRPAATAEDASVRLTTVTDAQLARRGFYLKSPSRSPAAVTAAQAEDLALQYWPGGSVREKRLVGLRNPPSWLPESLGDVWLVSVAPAGDKYPTNIGGGELAATFVLEMIDATSAKHLWRGWGN